MKANMDYETLRNSMTVQDAARVLRDTNCYGTMDIAKSVIIKALEQQPSECEYCHEDSDGYVKPLEKNCHAYIRFGMHNWVIELKAKGWRGKAPINFCPMCGRRLTNEE